MQHCVSLVFDRTCLLNYCMIQCLNGINASFPKAHNGKVKGRGVVSRGRSLQMVRPLRLVSVSLQPEAELWLW